MLISVVYVNENAQSWIEIKVEDNCTAKDAISQSGLLLQYPEIDLARMKIGIFGKFTKPDSILQEGDRVEIYRPITRSLDDDEDDD
jgi:putative ubiquitin-RnfH superfamily antitoxin RatB of RatAB toxin-antitoxin module